MLDIDRELSAQYLAAVARELAGRGLHVEASVLHDQSPGGAVVVAFPTDQPAEGPLPLCAQWDGGRHWTILTGFPDGGGRTRRARLRLRHLPAPTEVADFVAGAAANAPGPPAPVVGWAPR
jgi:hypothetical protein